MSKIKAIAKRCTSPQFSILNPRPLKWIFVLGVLFLLAGCSFTPATPQHIENICDIFKEYPDWYWSAQKTRDRWHIPISVLMAIIYQESHFNATARPPREKLLWIIPWARPSTAYGYSQALNETWRNYKGSTGQIKASRDAFADATDFIGWYANQVALKTGVPKANASAYTIYLAYHEGIQGYLHQSYLKKPWLMQVSHQVQHRAWVYQKQLLQCEAHLPKKPWWRGW